MPSLKLVIDKSGPMGSDCTSRDMAHFEDLENPQQNPATPKLCDAIGFALACKDEYGKIKVYQSYNTKADALCECLAEFEYRYGELLSSYACLRKVGDRFVRVDIDELLRQEVMLISIAGGWSQYNYHLVLATPAS